MRVNYKFIYRGFAVIFAFLVLIYPLSQMISEPVRAVEKQIPTLTAGDENITEIQPDNAPTENSEPYAKLSANARKAAAAVNIPLAGYESDTVEETNKKPLSWTDKLLAEIEKLKKNPPKSTKPQKTQSRKTPAKNSPNEWTSESWEQFISISADDGDNPIRNFDATYDSEIKEDGDTNYHITRTHDFGMKYTVTFNTGKSVDVGDAVIRIPSEIFRDRNNRPVCIRTDDGIALPMYIDNPTKNEQTDDYEPLYEVAPNSVVKSNRTQFGYFIETDENGKEYYVIVNYDPIRPGTNWFEIVYDEIKVFDIPDGTEWTIDPDINVQYKYETQRYVLGGFNANLDNESSTLQPVTLDWSNALPVGYDDPTAAYIGPNGDIYYVVKEPEENWQFANTVGYLYLNGTSEPQYKIAFSPSGQLMQQDGNGEWTVPVPVNIAPVSAMQIATICERVYELNGETHHDTYYCIDSADYDEHNREILVHTYYDSNGQPVYQERINDGISSYYEAVETGGLHWESNPHIKNWIPERKWCTRTVQQDTPENLTGLIDTEAKIESVSKKTGAVTSNVNGNLNSESQVLSFIPTEQQENANIDLQNNIYVLWEIDISGKDCTQPFELYIDEALSYYSRQQNYGDGSAVRYTYYDSASGNMVENVTDGSTTMNYDGRIVSVTGLSHSEIPVSPTEQPYQPISNSDGFWYIGSSDPALNSDPQNSGLTNVRNRGTYEKKFMS